MSDNFRHLVNATHPPAGSRRRPLVSLALLLLIFAPTVISVGCAVSSSNGLPELPPVRILLLNGATLTTAFQFSPYPAQILTTVGGTPPLTSCTAVAGTLPAGLTVQVNPANRAQCEILTLPGATVTQAPGTYTFTIRAADSGAPLTATQTYTITVQPGFVINVFTLENGTVNRPFDKKITTSVGVVGGVAPLLPDPNGCTATGLPAGLSIRRDPANANGCEIFGTPTASGTFSVVVTATDSASPANVRSSPAVQLIINPAYVMNAFTLANGTQGRVFGPVTVTTTGGNTPITCNAGGTLPAGLTVAADGTGRNCIISGTPTVSFGPANVTISATDTTTLTTANATVSQSASLTVNATLDITSLTLANGTVSRAYSEALTNVGGQTPFTWTNPGGMTGACAGLSVSAAGLVSGTPTTAGTCTFTGRVDDTATTTTAAGFAQTTVTITINAGILITKTSLANGKVGTALSDTLTFSGGNPPVTWTNPGGMTGACAGLSLSAAGAVTGTPTTAGACSFTARVDDTASVSTPAGFDQQTVTVTINPALTITSLSLANGTLGRAFSESMTNAGGQTPFTWSNPGGDLAAGACAGLSINAAGLVSGTPTVVGLCTFTARVDDTATTTTVATFNQQSITVIINPALQITSGPALLDAVQGRAYALTMTLAGGQSPFTWSTPGGDGTSLNLANAFCAGLSINAAGTISGTPTAAGACSFTARVDDTATASTAAGSVSPGGFTIQVQLPLQATLTQTGNGTPNVNLFDGVLGQSYGVIGATPTWNVTGGIGPYAWCISAGTTPGGMTGISANCGAPTAGASVTLSAAAITGSAALFNFTVRVIDTGNAATAAGLNNNSTQINIDPALTITQNVGTRLVNAVTLPDGVDLRPYGPSLADLTRLNAIFTAAGGITPYGRTVLVTGPAFPGTFACGNVGGAQVLCGSSGTPLPAGSAAAGPYTFDVSVTDSGNLAVPASALTLNTTLTVQPPLALTFNGPAANAVQGRSYGISGKTPLQETASGGLSAGGVSFTAPPTVGTPGAGLPTGFTCSSVGLIGTCTANNVTGTPGLYTPVTTTADDTANATTPNSVSTATTATNSFSLTVVANISITTVALANGTQGRVFGPVNVPFANNVGAVTCSGLGLPAGMTVPAAPSGSNCQIDNTPTANGTGFSVTVTATDTGNASVPGAPATTSAMALDVNAPLAITSLALADGVFNRAFSQSLTNSGGQTTFTWSNPGGMTGACAGLSVNAAGLVSGTPTTVAGGTCTFTARVDDTLTSTTAAGFDSQTITIIIHPALAFVTPGFTLPAATEGVAYSVSIPTQDGLQPLQTDPTGCTVSGLPAGLTIQRDPADSTACEILGTPNVGTAAGSPYTVVVTANDTASASTGSGSVGSGNKSLTVSAPAVVITTIALDSANRNTAYSGFTLTATGGSGNYCWRVGAGTSTCNTTLGADSLGAGACSGLNLSKAGAISGTPSTSGTCTVTYKVFEIITPPSTVGTSATVSLSIIVNPSSGLAISTTSLAFGVQGRTGYQQDVVTNAPAGSLQNVDSCTVTPGSLPTGLGIAIQGTSSCRISTLPTAAGAYTFNVVIHEGSGQTANRVFTVTIDAPLAITNTSPLADAVQNRAYTPGVTLAATGGGGTKSWGTPSGAGPIALNPGDPECAGLTISAAGVIGGTPTAAGLCSFTARVTDTAVSGVSPLTGTVDKAFDITVQSALAITTATPMDDAVVSRAYTPAALTATGGIGAFTWSNPGGTGSSLNALNPNCAGLSMNASGVITGTPTASGACTFTAQVADVGNGATGSGTASLPITINVRAVLAISSGPTLPDGVQSRAYSLTLSQTGGTGTFTWSEVAGSALADDADCAGLTLSAAGLLSGTPTAVAPAVCTFTAKVADSGNGSTAGGNTTKALTVNLVAPLALVVPNIPNARKTSVYNQAGPGITFSATGGLTPYQFSATGANFDACAAGTCAGKTATPCEGFSLNQTTGALTGTPVNAGTCSFTAQVDDDFGNVNPAVASANNSSATSIIVLDTLAFTAGSGTATVDVINIASNTFVTSIAIGGGTNPDQVATTADGRYVFVTSPGNSKLIVVDASTNTQVAGSPFDISAACTTPRGIAFSDVVSKRMYVACAGNRKVVAVDADPSNLGTTFGTVLGNVTVASATGTPQRIAFSPDGTQALVTSSVTDEITIIGANLTILAGPNTFITTCTTPMGVVFANNGLTAFVACAGSRAVSVIDTNPANSGTTYGTDTAQTATLLGGTGAAVADSIAITPDGTRLYVTLGGGGGGLPQISIIDNLSTTLDVSGKPGSALGVPCLAGGCFDTGNTSPIGIIIPPFGTTSFRIFIAMSGDASDSAGPTQIAPGVAILLYTPPSTTAGALNSPVNNPIVYATTTTAPRGIAFIPIPR